MSEKARFTKTYLAGLKPRATPYVVWDADVRQLGAKVLPSGKVSLFCQIYVAGAGKQVKKTLAGFSAHLPGSFLDDLRAKVAQYVAEARAGVNPFEAAAAAEDEPEIMTVDRAARKYLRNRAVDHADKGRTAETALRRAMERGWGNNPDLPLDQVSRAMCADHHLWLARNVGKHAADRDLSMLRAFFNWAIDGEYLDRNPTVRIKRVAPASKTARKRTLTPAERGRFAAALREMRAEAIETDKRNGYVDAIDVLDAVALLALTGRRKGAVLKAEWSEIDLDQALWFLPAEKQKNRVDETVELGDKAVAILRDLKARHEASPHPAQVRASWVFARRDGQRLQDVCRTFKLVLDRAGLPRDIRVHDLRRGFASTLVAADGAGLQAREAVKLTGHTDTTIFERHYVTNQSREPLRKALAAVEDAYDF